MGRGIAHAMAYAGHEIRLLDAKPRDAADFARFRADTLKEVEDSLSGMARLGAFDAAHVADLMARVTVLPLEQAEEALASAGIVFEAVPEVLDAKRSAFALFDTHCGPEALLASTTSTILSTDLAGMTRSPERFLNAHWLNPAFLVPLVEVSPAQETAPATVARIKDFLEAMGKVPVVCSASPGYIVPRIQALAMNEAARLVEEGVASAEDVDKAVKYGFGLRFAVLGLLEFIDWGGGDILYYASKYMADAMQDPRFEAPQVVQNNMHEGRIGLKAGAGFYDYEGRDVDAYRDARMAAFLDAVRGAGLLKPPVLQDPGN